MKFKDFLSALKIEIKHVYLLAGAENYYIDRAREAILSRLFASKSARNEGLTTLDCDNKIDLSEIINAIETAPLFSDVNVVLVKNATLFKGKAGDEEKSSDKQLERLSDVLKNMLETNYVIFTTNDAPDKRKKLYKTIDKLGTVLEAEPLRSYQLEEWLTDKLRSLNMTMDADARRYFNETAALMPEVSLGLLDNELDKVSLYVRSNRITRGELERVLASLPEISNFALIDAISDKNFGKAMRLFAMQNDDVKNLMITMALLVRQVRMLLRAKILMERGVKGKALAEPLGLNPFIAQKTGDASKKFSREALETAMIDLAEADYGLKTGRAGAELIERAMMRLLLS